VVQQRRLLGRELLDRTGFVAMVNGKEWGWTSPVTTLPEKIGDVSPDNNTWFSQSAWPKSGSYYDATYDIFIDPYPAPTDRNSKTELMIWLSWYNTKPLADHYYANGNAIPAATNVSLGGRTWDIYEYTWSNGGHTLSFLDRSKSGWWSGSLTPFFKYGLNRGFYTNDHYLDSVMAGWEFEPGDYTAHSWGAWASDAALPLCITAPHTTVLAVEFDGEHGLYRDTGPQAHELPPDCCAVPRGH
jgi:hypothetical protein